MRRLTALLCAALIATACTGTDTEIADRPDPPIAAEGPSGGDLAESYLLKEIHIGWARAAAPMLSHLWQDSALDYIASDDWDTTHTVTLHWECGTPTIIHFAQLGYDPENSDLVFGETKYISRTEDDLDGHARLYDLRLSDESGHFSETDSVTLTQERSTSTTHTVEMDVTISNETKVGGEFGGVGLEDTLTVAFGYKDTEEYNQASSESKSKTVTYEFDVELPAATATAILPQASDVDSATPFHFDGVHIFSPRIRFGISCPKSYPSEEWAEWYESGAGWLSSRHNPHWCRGGPGYTYLRISENGCWVEFDSILDFAAMINGKDVRWPGMENNGAGWRESRCKNACAESQHSAFYDLTVRHLTISGTQSRHYQDVITTSVQRLDTDDAVDSFATDHGVEPEHRPPPGERLSFPGAADGDHPDLDVLIEQYDYLIDGGIDRTDAGRIIAAKVGAE